MGNPTRFTDLEVLGDLKVHGKVNNNSAGAILYADVVKASKVEVNGGSVQGMQTGTNMSAGNNTTLEKDKRFFYVGMEMTASGKTFTLDLPAGYVCIVANEGSIDFTVKNVSGDTGTSLAAGKVALVVASRTANKTIVTVLN